MERMIQTERHVEGKTTHRKTKRERMIKARETELQTHRQADI